MSVSYMVFQELELINKELVFRGIFKDGNWNGMEAYMRNNLPPQAMLKKMMSGLLSASATTYKQTSVRLHRMRFEHLLKEKLNNPGIDSFSGLFHHPARLQSPVAYNSRVYTSLPLRLRVPVYYIAVMQKQRVQS
jgi:hypothetical protein